MPSYTNFKAKLWGFFCFDFREKTKQFSLRDGNKNKREASANNKN
jgi:hypothetical protein